MQDVFLQAEKQTKRQTGIELLRIISMLWIIMFHYADHGTVNMLKAPLSINWIILAFVRMGGGIGNCIFVLISGYLLYNKKFTLKRIIKLWLEVWFYSIVFGIICYTAGVVPFSVKGLIKMFMPVLFNEYWYMSTYVILYFLMPFINKIIACLNKKQHIYLIIVLMLFFSFIPTFAMQEWLSGLNNLPIFITLYLTGAYIKKYSIRGFSQKINILLVVLFGLLIWVSEVGFKTVHFYPFYLAWEMNKSSVIFIAVFIFIIFINWNPKLPKIMLGAASSVFGVYLIHIGRLNTWIFGKVFDNSATYFQWDMIIQLLTATVLIFTFSVVIDKVRYFCIEQPIMKKLNGVIEKGDSYLNTFLP